jgi:hypothetical protein
MATGQVEKRRVRLNLASALAPEIRNKKERRGRNPATGSDLKLSARKVVTFKCSGKLRDKINGPEPKAVPAASGMGKAKIVLNSGSGAAGQAGP